MIGLPVCGVCRQAAMRSGHGNYGIVLVSVKSSSSSSSSSFTRCTELSNARNIRATTHCRLKTSLRQHASHTCTSRDAITWYGLIAPCGYRSLRNWFKMPDTFCWPSHVIRFDSFYVSTITVGHSFRSTPTNGLGLTAHSLPRRSPIQVVTEVDVA